MHLKKPCQICNMAAAGLDNHMLQTTAPQHNVHLKNMRDRYDLWMYMPNVATADILVVLKSETIEVFQKVTTLQDCDLLLLLLPLPINIKTDGIRVRKTEGGIHIMMPKIERLKQTTPILLPIEP